MLRRIGVLIETTASQSAGRYFRTFSSRSRARREVFAPMESEPSSPHSMPRRSATWRRETTVFGSTWRRFMLG
jgi:hypothetical protein